MKRWLLPAVIGLFIISSTTFVVLLIASTTEITEEEAAIEEVNIAQQETEDKPVKEAVKIAAPTPERVEKIPEVKPLPVKPQSKPKEIIVTVVPKVIPHKPSGEDTVSTSAKPQAAKKIKQEPVIVAIKPKQKRKPLDEIFEQEPVIVATKPDDTISKELGRLAEEKKQVEAEKIRLKEEKRLVEEQLQLVKSEKQRIALPSQVSSSPESEQKLLQAEKDTIELQKRIGELQNKLVAVETDKKKLAEEKKLLEEAKKRAEEDSVLAVRGKKETEKEKKSVAEEKNLYQERSLRVEERIALIMDAYNKEADYAIADAKKAIARAKAAGADKYEPVWLKEAEEALEVSDAAQKVKDYGKSLVSAVESKEKASAAERNSREKLKNYNSNMVGECLRLISNWAH